MHACTLLPCVRNTLTYKTLSSVPQKKERRTCLVAGSLFCGGGQRERESFILLPHGGSRASPAYVFVCARVCVCVRARFLYSYEEEDTCMSHEEEDTCELDARRARLSVLMFNLIFIVVCARASACTHIEDTPVHMLKTHIEDIPCNRTQSNGGHATELARCPLMHELDPRA